jgi:flagellar FliL protein
MKKAVLFSLVGVVLLAAGGGGAWWFMHKSGGAIDAHAAQAPELPAAEPQKYVSLDKVIVMLRRSPEDAGTRYMSMDLVFTSAVAKEKETKEHLPMLRSVAVRALSQMTATQIGAMSIDELAVEVNKAFADSYQKERREKPFNEALIGKLIVE